MTQEFLSIVEPKIGKNFKDHLWWAAAADIFEERGQEGMAGILRKIALVVQLRPGAGLLLVGSETIIRQAPVGSEFSSAKKLVYIHQDHPTDDFVRPLTELRWTTLENEVAYGTPKVKCPDDFPNYCKIYPHLELAFWFKLGEGEQ